MKPRHIYYVLVVLLIFWAGGFVWFTGMIPNKPSEDKTDTDAIVVLTGGGLRLERGFELLAEGMAPQMFISGVEDGVTVRELLNKKEYHEFSGKIPPHSITLGYQARSTVGNAEEIASWVKREHIETIRLVSGNYHIPRSVYEIHRVAPSLVIIPDPVFPKHFENNEWGQSVTGIRLVVSEYHKYIISIITGK